MLQPPDTEGLTLAAPLLTDSDGSGAFFCCLFGGAIIAATTERFLERAAANKGRARAS
jgi:hypothetical protein